MNTRILIVDDEKDILVALKELLEMEGYEVSSATNGRDGYKIFQEVRPVLVISDMMMPIMNGYELIDLIRKDSFNPTVPIIMMSSVSVLSAVKNPPWNEFIRKPSDIDSIINAIKKLLT